jgi:cyclophilin family peptidyl-prolyl cis-trans isomerase
MSRQRRQEQRRQRQRQRRQSRQPAAYEPVGTIQFGGIFGLIQRHTRLFFIGGILVMIASLGAVFFPSSPHAAPTADDTIATAEAEASESATATAEASSEGPATPAAEPIVRLYGSAPVIEIDPEASYEAVLHTEAGDVRIELLADEAGGYVNNFVFLARNRFYEGLQFHRVVPGFVAQAGDPGDNGNGGPGYSLAEERNDVPFDAGVISMAKAGPIVNGSQFFITLDRQPALESDFTVFGRVTSGLELLSALPSRDPFDAAPDEPGLLIQSVEIVETPPE